jgi:hypothetical protein
MPMVTSKATATPKLRIMTTARKFEERAFSRLAMDTKPTLVETEPAVMEEKDWIWFTVGELVMKNSGNAVPHSTFAVGVGEAKDRTGHVWLTDWGVSLVGETAEEHTSDVEFSP